LIGDCLSFFPNSVRYKFHLQSLAAAGMVLWLSILGSSPSFASILA
jgi:hypothetical protein